MQIFVHNPHNRSVYSSLSDPSSSAAAAVAASSNPNNVRPSVHFDTTNIGNDINFFNINQTITCITTGAITSTTAPSGGGPGDQPSGPTNVRFNVPLSGHGLGRSKSRGAGGGGGKGNNSPSLMRKELSVKQRQTALNNDLLIVGTNTSIHVYDILHNVDLYYKEVKRFV